MKTGTNNLEGKVEYLERELSELQKAHFTAHQEATNILALLGKLREEIGDLKVSVKRLESTPTAHSNSITRYE